jgi:hypothetical protein
MQHLSCNTETFDQVSQQVDRRIDLRNRQEFVGLVRLLDRAGSDDDGFGLHRVEVGGLGAEGGAAASASSQLGQVAGDLTGFVGIHRAPFAEGLRVEFEAALCGHFCGEFFEIGPQRGIRHTRQETNVDQQGAGAANPVRIVATVNVAEVHRRSRDAECGIIVLVLHPFAVLEQRGHELVHALERVVAQRRIAGVAGLADILDGHGQVALVLTHRQQAGGLADDAVASKPFAVIRDQPGAAHGGFLVGGGDQRERVFQAGEVDCAAGA